MRTRSLLPNWIGEVLARVAATQPTDEPALTSLVVRTDGTIGDGFPDVVRQREALLPDDLELYAARERLATHRHFGAQIPEDGGEPVFTRQVAEKRRERERAEAFAPQLCPVHHIQLSRNGLCSACM